MHGLCSLPRGNASVLVLWLCSALIDARVPPESRSCCPAGAAVAHPLLRGAVLVAEGGLTTLSAPPRARPLVGGREECRGRSGARGKLARYA